MEINVFGKYKVKRTNNYSYISDRIGEEYYFDEDKSEQEEIINGGKLKKWIVNDLKDDKTISVHFNDNEIFMNNIDLTEKVEIFFTLLNLYIMIKR